MSNSTASRIGGVGIMGSAIATHFRDCGRDVRVFDIDSENVATLTAKGAKASDSAHALAGECDFRRCQTKAN